MNCNRLIRYAAASLTLLLWAGAAPARADEPPSLNKLTGVVVSKADGKPLADVQVALTHAEDANLLFISGGRLRAFGQDENVLYLFPKRNGRVKVEARTDAQGRFTVEGFTAPRSKYNFGATHPQFGSALLTDIIPHDYVDRDLRIELDPPAFVRTEIPPFDAAFTDAGWQHVSLELAAPDAGPEASAPPLASAPSSAPAASSAPATAPAAVQTAPVPPKIMFDLKREPGGSEREAGVARWGPLPAGRNYVAKRVNYSRESLNVAILFARTIALSAGQTQTVDLKPTGDIALSGKITAADDQALPGVNVLLHVGADTLIGALTDKEGQYELRNLPAGKHLLELTRRAAPSGFG